MEGRILKNTLGLELTNCKVKNGEAFIEVQSWFNKGWSIKLDLQSLRKCMRWKDGCIKRRIHLKYFCRQWTHSNVTQPTLCWFACIQQGRLGTWVRSLIYVDLWFFALKHCQGTSMPLYTSEGHCFPHTLGWVKLAQQGAVRTGSGAWFLVT